MATVRWTGGANDGNWSTGGNWSTASAPITGDDVYVEEGSQNITLGLSNAGVNLASLRISFNGTVGTSSTPLTIGCNSGTVVITGGGSFYKIYAGTGGISKIQFNPKNNGILYLAGGTTTTLETGNNGLIEVDAAAVVTNIYANGSGINMGYNATGVTLLNNTKSVVSTYRPTTTLNIGPSAIVVTNGTLATITTSTVQPMGRLNHKSQGTITTSIVQPDGMADAFGSTYAFTVTNSTSYVGYGRNFDKGETSKVTFTNSTAIIGGEA